MEMQSNSSFDDNDDDSSLLPLFKTMQSKRNFEDDDEDDDKYDNSSEIAPLFLGSFLLFSRKCGTHLLCRLPLYTNVDPKCTSLCFRTSRGTQDSRATKTNVIDLLYE